MNPSGISNAPQMPKLNLVSNAKPQTPVKETAKAAPAAEPSGPSADNAEEVAMALAAKLGQKNNAKEAKVNSSALNKRVESVQRVNELLDVLHAKDQEAAMSGKMKLAAQMSQHKLEAAAFSALENGEPAVAFLALKKLGADTTLSEKDRAKVKDIANDIATDARYNVSITASLNGAEISTKIFKDPEMASQLRMLVGNGTYEKLNTAQIMHTLLTSGKEENYDTLLGAYSEMLAGDLKSKTPSTNIQYLADSYSRLNEVASTASLLKSAGTTLQKINDKHETHVKSPAVLAKSVLEFSMKPGQAELETIATEFMRIGSGKKLFFANKFLNMLDKLPMPVWDSDIQKRDRAMTEVLHYTSNKTDFNSQFQPGMNKAFQ